LKKTLPYLVLTVVALFLPAITGAATNLHSNPSLEIDTTPADGTPDGWWTWGGGNSWVTEFFTNPSEARTGDVYAHLKAGASWSGASCTPALMPVVVGQVYTVGGWAKDLRPGGSPSASNPASEVIYYDSGGSRVDAHKHTISSSIASDGQYHSFSGQTKPIPEGISYITNGGWVNSNSEYNFDDFFCRTDAIIYNPDPTNSALNIPHSTHVLSWERKLYDGRDPEVEVWWGSADEPDFWTSSPVKIMNLADTNSFDLATVPITLSPDQEYFWALKYEDPDDGNWPAGVLIEGPVWNFKTLRTSPMTFYIDSIGGDDNNTGTSPGDAWQTLAPVNATYLIPGDQVLLKAGTSYTGQFKPSGWGSDGNPIIIDMYDTGAKPRINGQGNVNPTLSLENVEYFEVSNLEITNTGPTRLAGRKGVAVSASSSLLPIARHIYLRNLYVHDVNGSNVKADGGGTGIYIYCNGSSSRFDDLLIENCHLVRTDRNGIGFWNTSYNPATNWNPSTNVIIRGNLLEDIGGDGIVPIGCDGARVEHNTLIGGRMRALDYAAGMWPWGCTNTLFQFNEVTGMVGTMDGQAFDCDYHSDGTIFQYNYSHDNDGGLMLVCAPGDSAYGCANSVIRYNISENDGSNSRIFHISGKTINTKIYNNVIYVGSHLNLLKMVKFDQWSGGTPDGTQFYNNIFYVDGTVSYELDTHTNTVFENNVFYGNHTSPPSDPCAITSDPQLVSAGSGGSGLDSVDGYKLTASSPCITAGQTIAANGRFDYWRNRLDPAELPDIGAHAYTHTYPGDCDTDHDVDVDDLCLFAPDWLGVFLRTDLNGDGIVDSADFAVFAQDWQENF